MTNTIIKTALDTTVYFLLDITKTSNSRRWGWDIGNTSLNSSADLYHNSIYVLQQFNNEDHSLVSLSEMICL